MISNISESKLLTLIGNLLYAVGVVLMVYSYRYNTKVMGLTAMGISTIAPNEGSAEWKRRERLRKVSDWLFYGGMVLTFIGVVAQTMGALIS
jgi:uncharacterized membrane protein